MGKYRVNSIGLTREQEAIADDLAEIYSFLEENKEMINGKRSKSTQKGLKKDDFDQKRTKNAQNSSKKR